MRSSALQVGDRVLVRNLTPPGGPRKLRAFWEDQVHIVVARKGEGSPVYDVRPESSKGRIRTLHLKLLLSCGYLPGNSWEDLPPVKKSRTAAPSHCDDVQPVVQEETESDSEDDLPDISCLNLSPGHDRNDQTQIQLESTSKDEPDPDFPGAHSADVLGEIAAAANTTDTPPEAQRTEDPQTVEERDEQESTSNLGRSQRLR